VAQYSKDGKWYRGQILDAANSANEFEILFIDYGNKERVGLTHIKDIAEEFLCLPSQAYSCELYSTTVRLPDNGKGMALVEKKKNSIQSQFQTSQQEEKYVVRFVEDVHLSSPVKMEATIAQFPKISQFYLCPTGTSIYSGKVS